MLYLTWVADKHALRSCGVRVTVSSRDEQMATMTEFALMRQLCRQLNRQKTIVR